jgi:hypothetical protein
LPNVTLSIKLSGMTSPTDVADRYVALWNESDPDRRRAAVADLWAEDGQQILQPPREIRAAARAPGIGMTAVLEARGHAALEARATSAHDEFIAGGRYAFRRRNCATSSSSAGRWSPAPAT